MKSRSLRVRWVAAIAAVGAVLSLAPMVPAAGSTSVPKATPVIFVRGYGGWHSCPGTDVARGYWGDAILKLTDAGWQAPLLPVSYYTCDTDGVDITGYGPTVPAGATATITPDSPRAGYTRATSLRRIAHDLAWFVYLQFSRHGTPVDLVGYSMGGLLIWYALYRVAGGASNYPPYLTVPRAVTMSTPHAGLPADSARSLCGRSKQCQAMTAGSTFMTELTEHALDPQGRNGTYWAIAGSAKSCDLVPAWSALALGAAERVRFIHPCYAHGDYLWDYSDATDVTMKVTLPFASTTVRITDGPHSLAWLTEVLLR